MPDGGYRVPGFGRIAPGHNRFENGSLMLFQMQHDRPMLGTVEYDWTPGSAEGPMSLDELRDSLMEGLHKYATRAVDDAIAQRLLGCLTCIEADPKDPASFDKMRDQLDELEAELQTLAQARGEVIANPCPGGSYFGARLGLLTGLFILLVTSTLNTIGMVLQRCELVRGQVSDATSDTDRMASPATP